MNAIQALSWKQARAIVQRLEALNPFGSEVKSTFLKIEDENFVDGKQVQLYGFGISAKRYCLFTIGSDDELVMRKCSEHSLKLLLSPEDPEDPDDEEEEERDPNEGWIADTSRRWVAEMLGRAPDPPLPWASRPAVTRVGLSSPHVLKRFVRGTRPKGGYPNQFKPFNFGLGVQVRPLGHPKDVDPDRCRFVGPFSRDPREWLAAEWVDIDSKRRVRIATGGEAAPNIAAVKTVGEYLAQYRVHPEAKSAGPDGRPCDHDTTGLLQRRHVTPTHIIHTGKESNRLEALLRIEVKYCFPRGEGESRPPRWPDRWFDRKFMQAVSKLADTFHKLHLVSELLEIERNNVFDEQGRTRP